jgi:hypothetical protein
MTVRRTFAALSVGLVVAAVPATALAVGRPHNMPPAAYHALVAQSRALNAHYGNAVTRLSSSQFIELYRDGGSKMSPEALNALVVRSEAQNALAASQFHGMPAVAYSALVAQSKALNARYGNEVTRLTPKQFIELYNDGGSKLTPDALNALIVRSQAMNRLASASTTTSPVTTGGTSFAWDDFGIGVAAALGAILLLGGIAVAARTGRRTGVAARVG